MFPYLIILVSLYSLSQIHFCIKILTAFSLTSLWLKFPILFITHYSLSKSSHMIKSHKLCFMFSVPVTQRQLVCKQKIFLLLKRWRCDCD